MDAIFKQRRTDRMIGSCRMELNEAQLEVAGQKLTPDDFKAYFEFNIAQGLQLADGKLAGISAYNTGIYPKVVANSYAGMLHQVVNKQHRMKANEADPEKKRNTHDANIGAVVAVEFPIGTQFGLKQRPGQKNPIVRGAAVLHKRADGVAHLLGEHQSGKHKHTVSMEVNYSLLDSGFLIGKRGDAKKAQEETMAGLTPDEFSECGYGYVPFTDAPDELLKCYNTEKSCVDKQWGALPVALLKGGLDQSVGFMGVGVVRYGAEREAEIQQLLATHPDALEIIEEEGWGEFLQGSKDFLNKLKKVVDTVSE